MILQHLTGLFTNPTNEWKNIRKENCSIGRCYCSHVLLLAAIPVIAFFVGTTQVGWTVGKTAYKFTTTSGLHISLLFYATILFGIFSVGASIYWMAKTYDAKPNLPLCVALAAYTATPLLLVGVMVLYPILWLVLLVSLPALAYSVYLLYTGVPIMMEIPKEKGFLFASAVLAVGLVMLVGIIAAMVILWDMGIKPVISN